jgi:transposase-like protein
MGTWMSCGQHEVSASLIFRWRRQPLKGASTFAQAIVVG